MHEFCTNTLQVTQRARTRNKDKDPMNALFVLVRILTLMGSGINF